MDFWTDKVALDIISYVFASTSIFSLVGRYSHKHLNSVFWGGTNPHQIKANAIDAYINKAFLGFTLLAVVIQLTAMILNDDCIIKDRTKSIDFYFITFFVSSMLSTLIIFISIKLSKALARKEWLPKLATMFYKNLGSKNFVLNIRNIHYDNFINERKRSSDELDKYRTLNIENTKTSVDNLWEHFELPDSNISHDEKLKQLNELIEKNYKP